MLAQRNKTAVRPSAEALEVLIWLGKGMPKDVKPESMSSISAQGNVEQAESRALYLVGSDINKPDRIVPELDGPARDSDINLMRMKSTYNSREED
jgi:hypothetical protein